MFYQKKEFEDIIYKLLKKNKLQKATIRTVCFSETIKKFFGISDEEIKISFTEKRQNLLGKEIVCSGRTRVNKAFGNLEFITQEIEEANPEKVIEELTT